MGLQGLPLDWLPAAIDYGVLGLLAVLNVIVVAVALERAFFYRAVALASFTPCSASC